MRYLNVFPIKIDDEFELLHLRGEENIPNSATDGEWFLDIEKIDSSLYFNYYVNRNSYLSIYNEQTKSVEREVTTITFKLRVCVDYTTKSIEVEGNTNNLTRLNRDIVSYIDGVGPFESSNINLYKFVQLANLELTEFTLLKVKIYDYQWDDTLTGSLTATVSSNYDLDEVLEKFGGNLEEVAFSIFADTELAFVTLSRKGSYKVKTKSNFGNLMLKLKKIQAKSYG